MPRAPACDKLRCERTLFLVSGVDVRDLVVFRVREVSGERLVKRTRRGAASTPERADLLVLSDDAAAPATLCYQSSGRCST